MPARNTPPTPAPRRLLAGTVVVLLVILVWVIGFAGDQRRPNAHRVNNSTMNAAPVDPPGAEEVPAADGDIDAVPNTPTGAPVTDAPTEPADELPPLEVHNLPDWVALNRRYVQRRLPGMEYVLGGPVIVGTPPDQVKELGQGDITNMTMIAAETPRHDRRVSSFWIDTTEVTNLQWQVYLEATEQDPSETLVNYGWFGGTIPDGLEQYPVSNVNIPEIRDFLAWSGKRLPLEAEWVRAARGDSDDAYPWGPRFRSSWAQTGLSVPQQAVQVASYPDGISLFGALDMTGNVFEWTDSPFVRYPGYQPITFTRGRKQSKLSPAFSSHMRVIKGGAFNSTREVSRIDFRIGMNPGDSDQNIGFRAARDEVPGITDVRNRIACLPSSSELVPPLDRFLLGLDVHKAFGLSHDPYDNERRVLLGHESFVFIPRWRHARDVPEWEHDPDTSRLWLGVFFTSVSLLRPELPPGLYSVEVAVSLDNTAELRFHDLGPRVADAEAVCGPRLLMPTVETPPVAIREATLIPVGHESPPVLSAWSSATGRSLRLQLWNDLPLAQDPGQEPIVEVILVFEREFFEQWR